MSSPPPPVRRLVEQVVASTTPLLHSLDLLDDDAVREPSLLPDWTRGHVLTHLARNADGLGNLLTWARTGVETPMYVSREQRAADIEAGAHRPCAALVNDVKRSNERLVEQFADLEPEQWDAQLRTITRSELRASDVPHLRRLEVEIHHVDLDLDYTLAHLPRDLVNRVLDDTARDLGERGDVGGFVLVDADSGRSWQVGTGGPEVSGTAPSLLGWVLGRTDGIGVYSPDPLPHLGPWR